MTELGYPSGKKIDTGIDDAGRVKQVTLGSKTYANGFTYTPHGEASSMTLGNTLVNATAFNSRLQPTMIQLGTATSAGSLLEIDYRFNDTNVTNNNGNVLEQTIKINGTAIADQNYTYDRVNRLKAATETFNSATSWSRTFDYDQYGNMWVSAAGGTPGIPLSPLTPQSQSAYNSATNQLVASQYDLSGNQTGDAPPGSGNTFTYDAENLQVTFNGTAGQYSYDGDGHRVTKTTSAGTTVFVYDVSGQLIAEYGGPTSTSNAGTSYLTTDHLGSTRVVTDSNGAVISRHDYLPFGEEIQISQAVTIGGRTTTQGYGGTDDTRQRFTSKERDNESGLDYFEARYFSSMQGRFTSPDEFTGGPEDVEDFTDIASDNPTLYADIHEPQSFNKYQYCYNNPLRYIDPTGHDAAALLLRLAAAEAGEANPASEAAAAALVLAYVWEKTVGWDNTAKSTKVQAINQDLGGGDYIARARAQRNAGNQAQPQQNEARAQSTPNPDGQKGAPDHQAEVQRQADKERAKLKPGETVLKGKKIQGVKSTRRPDVQVVGRKGKVKRVVEVERNPNGRRHRIRQQEYDRLKVPHRTVTLPKRKRD
jgi:RHS repeat-associated protein